MNKVCVTKLDHPERSGDWHDKPLKWKATGPNNEIQKFSTRQDAETYAKFRRRMSASEAHQSFLLADFSK